MDSKQQSELLTRAVSVLQHMLDFDNHLPEGEGTPANRHIPEAQAVIRDYRQAMTAQAYDELRKAATRAIERIDNIDDSFIHKNNILPLVANLRDTLGYD